MNLAEIAEQMRSDSERWFPHMHDGSGLPLDVFYSLGLSGEVGEVANLVKKLHRDGSTGNAEGIDAELADVLAYLFLLADFMGVDLEAAYQSKRAINEERFGK